MLIASLVSVAAMAMPANGAPATASIALSPSLGPPSTTVFVSGAGFGPSETVNVTFDSRLVARGTTDPQGTFANVRFKAPADASPGSHQVEAMGRTSGLSASATFTVRTDW